jgi:hypothetical protein
VLRRLVVTLAFLVTMLASFGLSSELVWRLHGRVPFSDAAIGFMVFGATWALGDLAIRRCFLPEKDRYVALLPGFEPRFEPGDSGRRLMRDAPHWVWGLLMTLLALLLALLPS